MAVRRRRSWRQWAVSNEPMYVGSPTPCVQLSAQIGAQCVGVAGGVAILYRPQDEPGKRRISLPSRGGRAHAS